MLKEFLSRTYQLSLKMVTNFLDWNPPTVINCVGCTEKLAPKLAEENIDRVLIVTDHIVMKTGLLDSFLKQLDDGNIIYFIYRNNEMSTASNGEQAAKVFTEKDCQAIIGFGGGKSLDSAKAAGIFTSHDVKDLKQFKGLFKLKNKLPYSVLVPTTAGSGTEATISTILTDDDSGVKYTVVDSKLMPKLVVLDPELLLSLPEDITAYEGMDALSHAIESYLSKYSTKQTRNLSEEATELIFNNLLTSYQDGFDIKARTDMQRAAYFAGKSIAKTGVGNAHALAHALESRYDIQHGQLVAYILPFVLEKYGSKVHEELAKLADITKVADSEDDTKTKAEKFIDSIRTLNKDLNIELPINSLHSKEIYELAKLAHKEANPMYPVPVIFSKDDFQGLLERIFPNERRIA